MQYFRVADDMNDVDAWILGFPQHANGEKIAPINFDTGIVLDYDTLEIPVIKEGVQTDLTCLYQSLFVANSVAANFLSTNLGNDVQLVPVTTNKGDRLFLVNILCILDCLDLARSKFDRYPEKYPLSHLAGQIRDIFSLCLQAEMIRNHHLFRLANQNSFVFMSSLLLEKINQEKIQGVSAMAFPLVTIAP